MIKITKKMQFCAQDFFGVLISQRSSMLVLFLIKINHPYVWILISDIILFLVFQCLLSTITGVDFLIIFLMELIILFEIMCGLYGIGFEIYISDIQLVWVKILEGVNHLYLLFINRLVSKIENQFDSRITEFRLLDFYSCLLNPPSLCFLFLRMLFVSLKSASSLYGHFVLMVSFGDV